MKQTGMICPMCGQVIPRYTTRTDYDYKVKVIEYYCHMCNHTTTIHECDTRKGVEHGRKDS